MASHHPTPTHGVWLFAVTLAGILLGMAAVLDRTGGAATEERNDGGRLIALESEIRRTRHRIEFADERGGKQSGEIRELRAELKEWSSLNRTMRERHSILSEEVGILATELIGMEAEVAEKRDRQEKSRDIQTLEDELAKLNKTIAWERKRWKEATGVINYHTTNKTRPVKEGSAAYYKCVKASRIIDEVEAKASRLKRRKESLERQLEKARSQ